MLTTSASSYGEVFMALACQDAFTKGEASGRCIPGQECYHRPSAPAELVAAYDRGFAVGRGLVSSFGGPSDRISKGMESDDPPGLYPPCDM